jgi:hypothetical protein
MTFSRCLVENVVCSMQYAGTRPCPRQAHVFARTILKTPRITQARKGVWLCFKVLTNGQVIEDNIPFRQNSELLVEDSPFGNVPSCLIGLSVDVQEQQKMRRS